MEGTTVIGFDGRKKLAIQKPSQELKKSGWPERVRGRPASADVLLSNTNHGAHPSETSQKSLVVRTEEERKDEIIVSVEFALERVEALAKSIRQRETDNTLKQELVVLEREIERLADELLDLVIIIDRQKL